MNKTEETLRDDIRIIRRNHKITQKEMGEKLGIDESAYSRIESGEIAISYSHLLGISDALGMSIADILSYPANQETCEKRKMPELKNKGNKFMVELEIDENAVIKMKLKDGIYQLRQ